MEKEFPDFPEVDNVPDDTMDYVADAKKPTAKSSKQQQQQNEAKSAVTIDDASSANDDDSQDDGSGGRVRPKFFCCGAMTKNQARASVTAMLQEQQEQLARFRRYAEASKWTQIHSGHFDWFMFPIEDGSQRKYNVFQDDVTELKNNRKWILGYREAVELCARAWGWNVKCKCEIVPLEKGMGWTDWDVRLAKIIRSLWLFGEKQYMESMQMFARKIKPNGGLSYGRISLDEVFYMKCAL